MILHCIVILNLFRYFSFFSNFIYFGLFGLRIGGTTCTCIIWFYIFVKILYRTNLMIFVLSVCFLYKKTLCEYVYRDYLAQSLDNCMLKGDGISWHMKFLCIW